VKVKEDRQQEGILSAMCSYVEGQIYAMKQSPNCCIKMDLFVLINVCISSNPLLFFHEHVLNESKNNWEVKFPTAENKSVPS
jgi:hypothetical protein